LIERTQASFDQDVLVAAPFARQAYLDVLCLHRAYEIGIGKLKTLVILKDF
jgi:hypothetical protein